MGNSVRVKNALRRSHAACLTALLMLIAAPTVAWGAEQDALQAPDCLDRLATFAAERNIDFDPARITFGPRWAGAGHEVKRLPGLNARLPVEQCGATLSVDLGPQCRIVKSRGEGRCREYFPLTFH